VDELAVGEIEVLLFTRGRDYGTPTVQPWETFVAFLSRPTVARVTYKPDGEPDDDEDKRHAGGWSPALYRDNHRKQDKLIRIHALVVDVDGGSVDVAARELSHYRVAIHSTYKSTRETPRCRVVLPFTAPVDVATYKAAHAPVRAHFVSVGLVCDDGASDASRLSYSPMVRPPEHPQGAGEFLFHAHDGRLFDPRACIARQPTPAPPSAPRVVLPESRDAYVKGALARAAANVAAASVGERHGVMVAESTRLARPELDLCEDEIARALIPAFAAVKKGGEREGLRIVRDQFRFARGAA
jgi:hypothetical protein